MSHPNKLIRRWKVKGLKVCKAQSILEYVILLTVVVAAVIVGITAFGINANKTVDQTKGLGKLLFKMNEKMVTESARIANMAK